MKISIGGVASAVALLACATSADAEPAYAFDKLGATPDQVVADMQSCADRASKIPVASAPIVTTSLVGGLAAGLAVGVMEGVQRAHAVTAAADTCMLGLGYSRLELTPEEDASMRAARSREAKRAWIKAFAAKDWSARIAAAAAVQPKVLPQLTAEPFAVEGVRLDPASLKVADGAVANYHPLLTGALSHRRTAVLQNDLEARGMLRLQMKSGAVLYGVDAVGTSSAEQTTLWCGPAEVMLFGRPRHDSACVFSTDGGGFIIPAGANAWMMSPGDVPKQVKPIPITSGTAALSLSDTDTIGPMDLTLEALSVEADRVRLRATASREGKKAPIWTGDLSFDKAGQAVLPFWSKRLVLTRSYDKSNDRYLVQATLEDGGTGAGWFDQGPVATTAQASSPSPSGG